MLAELVAERQRRILASVIGVMHQASLGPAAGDGHVQRVGLRVNGEAATEDMDAVFVFIGTRPRTSWLPDNVLRDSHWGVIVTSGANDVVIDHNTFIDNDVGVEMWDATGVQVTNDLVTSDHGTGIRLQANAPLTEDYDLWQIHGVPFVIDTDELDLAGWQAATAQGAHSTVVAPGVPLIGSDLRVLAGSPAAGAASDGSDLGTRVFP